MDKKMTPDLNSKIDSISNGSVGHEGFEKPTETASGEKKGIADKAGEIIERIGHKVSEAGAPGLGQKIHDLGDKLESDHKNPSHPHDV